MATPLNLTEQPFPTTLVEELHELVDRPIRVMVICGTQTRTLLKYSDEDILPEDLEIVTGPGCSICVMPAGHIDAFVKIGRQPDVITATELEQMLVEEGLRIVGEFRSGKHPDPRGLVRRFLRTIGPETIERLLQADEVTLQMEVMRADKGSNACHDSTR